MHRYLTQDFDLKFELKPKTKAKLETIAPQ